MEAVARFRSTEARELRNDEESRDWELCQMRGGIHRPNRAVLQATFQVGNLEKFGMDRHWQEIPEMSGLHILVVLNDRAAAFAWDFCTATILEWEQRLLPFTEGLPRRQTMLLSPIEDEQKAFIDDVLLSSKIFNSLVVDESDWTRSFTRSSVFQKTDVQQLVGCIEEEDCKVTDRLSMRCLQQHYFLWNYLFSLLSSKALHCTHTHTPISLLANNGY